MLIVGSYYCANTMYFLIFFLTFLHFYNDIHTIITNKHLDRKKYICSHTHEHKEAASVSKRQKMTTYYSSIGKGFMQQLTLQSFGLCSFGPLPINKQAIKGQTQIERERIQKWFLETPQKHPHHIVGCPKLYYCILCVHALCI